MKIKVLIGILLCGILLLGITGCGNLDLTSNKVINDLSKTEKIIVQKENDKKTIREIIDKKEIKEFINMVSQATKEDGWVTLEENNWNILMYNEDDEIIYTILGWYSGHIGFEDKEYKIEDSDKFVQMMEG